MRRLAVPQFDGWATTISAASKFSETPLRNKVLSAQQHFQSAYAQFDAATANASWHTLSACLYAQGDQVIIADLTKAELKSLYEDGFVRGLDAAREIYDEIKVGAKGKCPYCGGIGDVEPLDHYLPKSRYPQFAVLPANLIPSCDRCNKLSGFGVVDCYTAQSINPYFDDDKFFDEIWVSVEFLDTSIFSYVYKCDPPEEWEDRDKLRVQNHFDDFLLAQRYAAAARSEVSYLASDFMATMVGSGQIEVVRDELKSRANSQSFPSNSWLRPIYRALIDSDWFLDRYS